MTERCHFVDCIQHYYPSPDDPWFSRWAETTAHPIIVQDAKGVRTVTLWFNGALQFFDDGFTCPWFIPAVVDWAKRP